MPSPFPLPVELLPHRPPMLLVRAVLSHHLGETCCEGIFDARFARVCGGEVTASFGLELIAQTAAVHHGLRERALGLPHAPAARGLLLGSRRFDLRVHSLPVGEPLRVSVVDSGQGPGVGGLIRFEGHVQDSAGRTLVSGDATVLEWRPDV